MKTSSSISNNGKIGVIALIATFALMAGCLDDFSSHGCCAGTKTSVITIDHSYYGDLASRYSGYVVDSNGCRYTWGDDGDMRSRKYFDKYNGHNVTFSYHSRNGHYRIDDVLVDHDACCEVKSCECGCSS